MLVSGAICGRTRRLASSWHPPVALGKPVCGVSKPVRGVGKPVRGVGRPVRGVGKPVRGVGKPVRGVGKPVWGVGKPVWGVGKPLRGVGKPVRGGSKPVRGGSKPVVGLGAGFFFGSWRVFAAGRLCDGGGGSMCWGFASPIVWIGKTMRIMHTGPMAQRTVTYDDQGLHAGQGRRIAYVGGQHE